MERFMELYETVYRDMYRLAYYYMGNGEDAEDAVQDAALSACEQGRVLPPLDLPDSGQPLQEKPAETGAERGGFGGSPGGV